MAETFEEYITRDGVKARLTKRIQRLIRTDANGCWIWQGYLSRNGRGRMIISRWTREPHRVSYLVSIGPVPDGLELDHLCAVPSCVNPDHLEPVTHAENIARRYAAYTHCKNGHEFTPENTYQRPGNRRGCRTCNRHAVARMKARRKAAA